MTGLNETHVTTILFNMLCAVEFVHSANLMHRDIKPANFLIDEDCCICLADFGSARPILQSLKSNYESTNDNTPDYVTNVSKGNSATKTFDDRLSS